MVRWPRRPANCRMRVAPWMWMAGCLFAAVATAEEPPHFLHAGNMPPGAIGSVQLTRGGPLPDIFSRWRSGARGRRIAPAANGAFQQPQSRSVMAGMLIGAVYRLRLIDIPQRTGEELYPTVEVIDRLYPPLGHEGQFPILIELRRRPRAGAGRQVRDPGDLPGRSARRRCPWPRTPSSRVISRWRRETIPWPWPIAWAAQWPSCESAAGCRTTTGRTRHSSTTRRRGCDLHSARLSGRCRAAVAAV